jgi:transcriptional regulator with XRE-family HTH domain
VNGMGSRLQQIRRRLALTLRDVEQQTARVAQRAEMPGYRISASWLNRVEREDRELSGTKLIVLVSVYSLTNEEVFALCPGITAAPEVTPSDEPVPIKSSFTNCPCS